MRSTWLTRLCGIRFCCFLLFIEYLEKILINSFKYQLIFISPSFIILSYFHQFMVLKYVIINLIKLLNLQDLSFVFQISILDKPTNQINILSFQAGEFFQSAQNRALEQQRELESRQGGESMETPLLQDQVCFLVVPISLVCVCVCS